MNNESLSTVNVIELLDGSVIQVIAFFDTIEGNEKAEKLFEQLLKEHNDPDWEIGKEYTGPIFSAEDINEFIEDGVYDDDCGYSLRLVHSSTIEKKNS